MAHSKDIEGAPKFDPGKAEAFRRRARAATRASPSSPTTPSLHAAVGRLHRAMLKDTDLRSMLEILPGRSCSKDETGRLPHRLDGRLLPPRSRRGTAATSLDRADTGAAMASDEKADQIVLATRKDARPSAAEYTDVETLVNHDLPILYTHSCR